MDLNDGEIIKLTGPLLITTVLNWGLVGVLSVQVFLYSQAFPNDRSVLKAIVYGVYLLEMAQTVLLTGSAWATFVTGFGQDDSLFATGTTWVSLCLLGGATAMVVQTFYAYRIMIISQNKIIPSLITLLSLISFVAAVVVGVIIKQAGNFDSIELHTLRMSSFIGIWIGTGSACDIAIAASMCFYLSRRIRGGLFPKTQALISKVMRMTVETGTLTATISFVSLVLFYAPTVGGFIFYGVPISVLAKLYSNTMLALLNSRIKLGIASESTTWQDNEFPQIPFSLTTQQNDGIELRFASEATSDTASVIPSKEAAIAIDRAKITFSTHTK